MTGIEELERCFLPLDRREPPKTSFLRVIGRDKEGRVAALLDRFRPLAQSGGACLRDGIRNPTDGEIARFYGAVDRQVPSAPGRWSGT